MPADDQGSTAPADASRKEFKHVLDRVACGVLIADTAGRVWYANRAASELFPRGSSPLVGSVLEFPVAPGRSEIALPRALGAPSFVELCVEPCQWGGAAALLVMLTDITARKAKATEQERLLEVQRELVRSNREFSAFAHAAAHDLKSPLRQLGSFAELLAKDKQIAWHDKALTYLNFMRDAAARGSALVNRLLEYATYGGKALQVSPVDLNVVVKLVLSESRSVIEARNAQVIVDELPEIEGDKEQLKRVFENLISNALKYQLPESTPRIRVSVTLESQQDMCEIQVADNGIGFEQCEAERVFEPFQRLVSRSDYEGSGVGLATTQKIVAQHSGSITATSEPGVGSTFTVRLPVKQRAGAATDQAD